MGKGKTINRMCCIALAAMLLLTAIIWTGKAASGRQASLQIGYEALFDQSTVHTINIEMADWEQFLSSAAQEEYAPCAVTIDGERLTNVGIRAKGNTSLSSVTQMGSLKYSFKMEFDHYEKGHLYHGLDKLSLNNLIYDATMMKDNLAYTLMSKMGVPSPLCSYVQLTVNGEPWGLYLAVEGVEDSFLARNNMVSGKLYKPDSMNFGGGRGNGGAFDMAQFRENETTEEPADFSLPAEDSGPSFGGSSGQSAAEFPPSSGQSAGGGNPPEPPAMPSGNFNPPELPEEAGGSFRFGMDHTDVKLQYTDDDPDSYANIFDSAKTTISQQDKTRLIAALKTLSSDDAQEAVFADEVIRYLAVHDFLQNDDSYTGIMVHNYYLYEQDGRLAILPWDYNLAFGGMSASNGTFVINSPIDSPVSSGSTDDRPLISWIFEDEDALAQYHAVYDQLITDWMESGWLEAEISRVAELIRPYVASDPNAFYTLQEFDTAIETLQSFCALRGESIRGQLNGTIPSTTDGQRQNNRLLVESSFLQTSDMGSMNTAGGRTGSFPTDFPTVQPAADSFAHGGISPSSPPQPDALPPSESHWPAFAACVTLLLLALCLVSRVRGHNA